MLYPNQNSFLHRVLGTTMLGSALLLISSCSDNQIEYGKDSAKRNLHDKSLKEIIAEHKGKNTKKGEIAEGIDLMLAGNYEEAGMHFNRILMTDPTNPTVHLLSGINYQLKATDGDINQLDIAEAGLNQALKFNPANALASLQLGRVKKAKKRYSEAQEEFASTLLIDPDNQEALYELAATSYLMGDLKTARVAIERYLKTYPYKPEALQSAAVIRSACGDSSAAAKALIKLKSIKDQDFRAKEAQRRVLDWKKLYDSGLITLAQATGGADPMASAPSLTGGSDAAGAGAAPPAQAPAEAASATPSPVSGATAKPTMVVIDALVMRTSETTGSQKGNNILENFAVTLAPGTHLKSRAKGAIQGAGAAPDFSGVTVFPAIGTGANAISALGTVTAGGQNPFAVSRLFAQGVTFGSVQYSLNIANTEQSNIQVVDRPSVTTILGQKGEFFSGTEYVLGLGGQYGGNITRTPVGIELVVTPTVYDPETDTVTLDIRMYGSLLGLSGLADDVTKSFSEFNLSRVYTTVNMKMGETLMLGGIQTRTDQQDKNGFPILQDIPGLQYLFSNANTSGERKVVTFLITPRLAADAKKLTQMQFAHEKTREQLTLSQLELRNKDWFSNPVPNWVVHYKMMDNLYREFRTGDVPEMKWEQPENLQEKLDAVRSFFYY